MNSVHPQQRVTFANHATIIPARPFSNTVIFSSKEHGFYRQFTKGYKTKDQRIASIEQFERARCLYEIALLELDPDNRPELTNKIVSTMSELLFRGGYNKDAVFKHLTQSIIDLQAKIHQISKTSKDESSMRSTVDLRNTLLDTFNFCIEKKLISADDIQSDPNSKLVMQISHAT